MICCFQRSSDRLCRVRYTSDMLIWAMQIHFLTWVMIWMGANHMRGGQHTRECTLQEILDPIEECFPPRILVSLETIVQCLSHSPRLPRLLCCCYCFCCWNLWLNSPEGHKGILLSSEPWTLPHTGKWRCQEDSFIMIFHAQPVSLHGVAFCAHTPFILPVPRVLKEGERRLNAWLSVCCTSKWLQLTWRYLSLSIH